MQNRAADGGRLERYMTNLRQNYEDIQAAIYCDDWMVDAVLHSQAEVFKKKGIEFECNIQDFDIGSIEEQDFIQILMLLLHLGIEANSETATSERKSVLLKVAAVKNQLFVEFASTCGKNSRISKQKFRGYLKKYQGAMQVEKRENQVSCIMHMQRR